MLDMWKTHWRRKCKRSLSWKYRDENITWKYRDAAHWKCNINLKLTKKVPVIFHNLKGYDSNLIINVINEFDVKVSVIRIGLEKYMDFVINKNLDFIDSKEFLNSTLEKLDKKLSDNDLIYLTQEFGSENLMLLKQKDAYPYKYMNSFEIFSE